MDDLMQKDCWLKMDCISQAEKMEIQQYSPEESRDRFYQSLQFGTGGLRGVMGLGTNRMNRYVIRQATCGLARYLLDHFSPEQRQGGVCIAYDSRNNSKEFAWEAACVLNGLGLETHLFRHLSPTPMLSFAVPFLKAVCGIVITASHNPKEYNGYKVYDQFGCQLVPQDAKIVAQYIQKELQIDRIVLAKANNPLFHFISPQVEESFTKAVLRQSLLDISIPKNLKIVYTPLHGTGSLPVRRVLSGAGFAVSIVTSQELPDGDFSTVKAPNPEDPSALLLAVEQAKTESADIVLGTDPDCDRLGVAIRAGKDFLMLTGNQIGALLTDYVLRSKKRRGELSDRSVILKTVVTSDFGASIARKYGVAVEETLTGFKFIGDAISRYHRQQSFEFVMGYEESYGYLVGEHARDKDATVAALLICEAAQELKAQKKTLFNRLQELYEEYGYYEDAVDSFTLQGEKGIHKIQKIMDSFRKDGASFFPGWKESIDYQLGVGLLPKSNVIKFILEEDSWVAVRPSGTEPKLKFYFSVHHTSRENAVDNLNQLQNIVRKVVNP